MRKFFLLAMMLVTLTYCDKKVDCQIPPPEFTIFINKASEVHKEFVNQAGEVDKANISLYKQKNGVKESYRIMFGFNRTQEGNEYLNIGTQLWFDNDVYTGKTETLYLQNATKTYKIEVDGYMEDGECGKYAVINEIRVDGTKIEVPYLVK
ncbi:hypothetical protein [Capnocytophaga leadbetteri]